MLSFQVIKKQFVSLGFKVLLGVAITSNICIGGFAYIFWQSNGVVHNEVNNLLVQEENENEKLRTAIFNIQEKTLSWARFFDIQPNTQLRIWLDEQLGKGQVLTLQGRDSYKSLYSRTERRDLSKGRIVVQEEMEMFVVSLGLRDAGGNFTNSIEQRRYAKKEGMTREDLKNKISQQIQDISSGQILKQKIVEFKMRIADQAIALEEQRTSILSVVEELEAQKRYVQQLRLEKERQVGYVGIAIIVISLFVTYILIRVLIEYPLKKLISTIDSLHKGDFIEVPMVHRSDQIGVLAGVVVSLKERIIADQKETLKRRKEADELDATLTMFTNRVNQLEKMAFGLYEHAKEMEALAEGTLTRSSTVAGAADKTTQDTEAVVNSTKSLWDAVSLVENEVENQGVLIDLMGGDINLSTRATEELEETVNTISSIISLVVKISNQTKLLALNATIEAARAGEYGKGFGVVADEVKVLSYQTEAAAAEIKQKINEIFTVKQSLVSLGQKVQSGTGNLQELSQRINVSLNVQREEMSTISSLLLVSSETTKSVSEHIHEVHNAVSATKGISAKVAKESKIIADDLTEVLAEITKRLRHDAY